MDIKEYEDYAEWEYALIKGVWYVRELPMIEYPRSVQKAKSFDILLNYLQKIVAKDSDPTSNVALKQKLVKISKPVKIAKSKLIVSKTGKIFSRTHHIRNKPRVLKAFNYTVGKSDKQSDLARDALKPGKRISGNGKIYWESRKNRSDLK